MKHGTRRQLLGSATVGVAALSLTRCVTGRSGEDELPPPNFAETRVLRTISGLRPYRTSGPRLEAVSFGDKLVVHNYGYGGCGFTLSWGTAEVAADLVAKARPKAEAVGVLGAGAVGLACASVLLERGYRVSIYARDLTPNTVSDVAGAQWGPAIVEQPTTPEAQARFNQMLARAYTRFRAMLGSRWGVYERVNYFPDGCNADLDLVPTGVLAPATSYRRLPFAGVNHAGRGFRTLLIEPPRYLPAMTVDLVRRGAQIHPCTLASADDVRHLSETALINCTGMGAATLFNDPALIPIRGQLVHLAPEPLDYLLIHRSGYIFPRSDAVVLGGTVERGVSGEVLPADATSKILERNRKFFVGATS